MISVFLFGSTTATGQAPTTGEAVRTLSALVTGVVDGVFRDVHLLETAPQPDLAGVAEHAGCAYVADTFPAAVQRAAKAARCAPVLLLTSGVSFDRAFVDEAAGVVARHVGWLDRGIALKAEESGALGRLVPAFAPTVGILTTRDSILARPAEDLRMLWRKLRPRRMLKTRAWSGAAD